ncbi:MAG TPA: YdhR family protein [Puia sp.]|nr:YdhR family protein [Puia sp.]
MKNAEAVLTVKFQSVFSVEELMTICSEDLRAFREVPGLIQKYYLNEVSTGAISGIYVFEDHAARKAFLHSELASYIPVRYGVLSGTLRVEQYDMAIVLNDEYVTA